MAGLRPGEKLHEVLISEDESREAVEREDMFVLSRPPSPGQPRNGSEGRPLPEGFRYSSDTNPHWLRGPELLRRLETVS